MAHRGIELARPAHVDAEGRRPRDLGRNIDPRLRLADQLELRGRLQRRRGHRREVGDEIDEVAEARDRAVPSLRADLAVGGAQLGDRHARLAARRHQQQLARHRAGGAHRHPGVARRGRAAGRQHAQHAAQLAGRPAGHVDDGAGLLGRERQAVDQDIDVAIDAVFRRILDPHLVPARLHLLGDQHGQGGMDALPHLRPRHGHDHRVVARDLHPAVQPGLARFHAEQGAAAEPVTLVREPPADADKARADDAADDRLAAGEFHGAPPKRAAARCTARRSAL